MRPEEPQSPALSTPTTPASSQPPQTTSHRDAAADIARSQVNSAYASHTTSQATGQEIDTTNPYYRSRTQNPHPTPEQWKQYHSSWQNYYQTYYERYYTNHVHKARQALAAQNTQPVATDTDATIDKDEALFELRNRLVNNVQSTAVKVKKSRHFIPIIAAVCVMLLFLFLQYNRVLFANVEAYVSPGNVDPQNIIVDPGVSNKVDPASTQVIIPKINIDVPVDYTATPDHESQMKAMTNGLAYFGIPGANSKPGQVGNTPIAGHSSNDVLARGDYKFIFAQLDKLEKGDTIYANYKGTRYTYVVTKKEVVKPDQIGKLIYETDKPILTLITCTPLGTALKRLLVTAEQVSPSPSKASAAPSKNQEDVDTSTEIPGSSASFFERLFGAT